MNKSESPSNLNKLMQKAQQPGDKGASARSMLVALGPAIIPQLSAEINVCPRTGIHNLSGVISRMRGAEAVPALIPLLHGKSYLKMLQLRLLEDQENPVP